MDAFRLGNYTATLSVGGSTGGWPRSMPTSIAKSGTRTPIAAIIGSIIGGLFFIGVVIAIVWFRLRSRRGQIKRDRSKSSASSKNTHYVPVTNLDSRLNDEETSSQLPATYMGEDRSSQSFSTGNIAHHKIVTITESKPDDTKSLTRSKWHEALSGWPNSPSPIRTSRWTVLMRWGSDISIILMSVAFLVYAFFARAYDGVPKDHSVAKTLLKLAQLGSSSVNISDLAKFSPGPLHISDSFCGSRRSRTQTSSSM